MSEFIDNASKRQEKLKSIIRGLHAGNALEAAKADFKAHFSDVSTAEITAMEHALIEEGMQIEEVQRLCDVHAVVFEGSISDIHVTHDRTKIPGHPVQVFLAENARIEQLIKEEIEPFVERRDANELLKLRIGLDRLAEIHKHYARKEYLFFPNLEKKGITAPPKVMWAKDDEIRAMIRRVRDLLGDPKAPFGAAEEAIPPMLAAVRDMIVKENNILLPLCVETLSFFDWITVDGASEEIGWFLEKPAQSWKKETPAEPAAKQPAAPSGAIPFDAGSLSPAEANAIFNTLPFDLTFVDRDDKVKYFTQGAERVFERPKTIVGRAVSMCHPPQSVHVVMGIIESFRSGKKDHEDFWIPLGNRFVHIRYYAVRDKDGSYLGTLEVTQDIKPLRDLAGEKRLVEK